MKQIKRYILKYFSKTLIFGFLAALYFSLMNLCVKKLTYIPAQELVFFRSLITGLVIYLALKRNNISLPKLNNYKLNITLFWRGLFGYLALSIYFYSLKHLDISIATLIQYMSPLFTALLALIFLGERFQPKYIICLLTGILGIYFVSYHPQDSIQNFKLIYILICLLSTLMSAVAYIFVKKLTLQQIHPLNIMLAFSVISLPMSLILCWQDFILPVNIQGYIYLISLGLLSYGGQMFLTLAFKSKNVSLATNMLYLTPVLATIWGISFLGESITWNFIIGAIIILGSQLLILKK